MHLIAFAAALIIALATNDAAFAAEYFYIDQAAIAREEALARERQALIDAGIDPATIRGNRPMQNTPSPAPQPAPEPQAPATVMLWFEGQLQNQIPLPELQKPGVSWTYQGAGPEQYLVLFVPPTVELYNHDGQLVHYTQNVALSTRDPAAIKTIVERAAAYQAAPPIPAPQPTVPTPQHQTTQVYPKVASLLEPEMQQISQTRTPKPKPTPQTTHSPATPPAPAPAPTNPKILNDDNVDDEDSPAYTLPQSLETLTPEQIAAAAKHMDGLPLPPTVASPPQQNEPNEKNEEEHPSKPKSYKELHQENTTFGSVIYTDPSTGRQTKYWIPNILYRGDYVYLYEMHSPNKMKTILKSDMSIEEGDNKPYKAYHHLSVLKEAFTDQDGHILNAGEKIYEVGFDNDNVAFAKAKDLEGIVYYVSRKKFVSDAFQSDKPLEGYVTDLESYHATQEYKNFIAGIPDEASNPEANTGSDPNAGQEDPNANNPQDEHGNTPIHTDLVTKLPPQDPEDCNPKSGIKKYKNGTSINLDNLYKEKDYIAEETRRKYRKAFLIAANEEQIPPSILEASLHLESDYNEKKENTDERKKILIKLTDSSSLKGLSKAETYVMSKGLSVWGKGINQLGPAECASISLPAVDNPPPPIAAIASIDWSGSYQEYLNRGRPLNSVWNPTTNIRASARLMRMKLDQVNSAAAKRGLIGKGNDEIVNHMINRPGDLGIAEQARYILGMYNRGVMPVVSLTMYAKNHRNLPSYYGQSWSTPRDPSIKGPILFGENINRAHVYRAAGLCGGIRPGSLIYRYQKNYSLKDGIWIENTSR